MCVILYTNINGKQILAKNRDRNYKPNVRIIHEIINGIEIVYLLDKNSGWIEGMNENGLGIVNSTLSKSDTSKKKYKKKHIFNALISEDKKQCFNQIKKVEGNNLLIYNDEAFHIGNNTRDVIVNKVKNNTVYSNHLLQLKNSGFTTGKKGMSSFLRRKITEHEINNLNSHNFSCNDKLYEEISGILNRNYENVDPRFHPYRDEKFTVKKLNISKRQPFISTTGQIILDMTDMFFVYYTDVNNSEKVEYVNQLPNDYNPKIRVIIKETEKKTKPHKIFTKRYLKNTYKKFNHSNNKTQKLYK